jgi:hypothetical protein
MSLIVLYYICTIGIYHKVYRTKKQNHTQKTITKPYETIRNGQRDVTAKHIESSSSDIEMARNIARLRIKTIISLWHYLFHSTRKILQFTDIYIISLFLFQRPYIQQKSQLIEKLIPLIARCTLYNIYVIKFVSDLQQIDGFLRVPRFPLPIKLIATT